MYLGKGTDLTRTKTQPQGVSREFPRGWWITFGQNITWRDLVMKQTQKVVCSLQEIVVEQWRVLKNCEIFFGYRKDGQLWFVDWTEWICRLVDWLIAVIDLCIYWLNAVLMFIQIFIYLLVHLLSLFDCSTMCYVFSMENIVHLCVYLYIYAFTNLCTCSFLVCVFINVSGN